MKIEFDLLKDRANFSKHQLSLGDFKGFDTEMATVVDDRADYGEVRYCAYGRIEDAAYCVVYTRRGDTARLISFRRMHAKEARRYE